MRLFVALDIDREIREKIAAYRDQLRPLAPDVRWVNPEAFHITLQFLGETKKLDEIKQALAQVTSQPIKLQFRGTGFFPNPKSARVFWVGIEVDQHLQPLVLSIGKTLAPLGFILDSDAYTPHLTLARAGSGRPHSTPGERSAPALQLVRTTIEELPAMDFGTMTASEFYLYESKLSPAGPKYSKLARYSLDE